MIERIYEMSRIRRGRLSTVPTWFSTHDGVKHRFSRKRDAVAFEKDGCPKHWDPKWSPCPWCHGVLVEEKKP